MSVNNDNYGITKHGFINGYNVARKEKDAEIEELKINNKCFSEENKKLHDDNDYLSGKILGLDHSLNCQVAINNELKTEITKLKFMIENGLGYEDLKQDI